MLPSSRDYHGLAALAPGRLRLAGAQPLQNGLAYGAVEYLEALRWRAPALAALLRDRKCDAVLAPVSRAAAPTSPRPTSAGPAMPRRSSRHHALMRPINISPSGPRRSCRPCAGRPADSDWQLIGRPSATRRSRRSASPSIRDRSSSTRSPPVAMTAIVEVRDLHVRFTASSNRRRAPRRH